MRILILSQYYAPEPISKPHELAVGLVEKGHQVLAITAFPNYPHGSIYQGYRLRPWQWEMRDGIRILRLPLFPDHSRSAIRRILNYTSFMATSSLLGPVGGGKADVMYVWHPPLTMGVSAWIIGLMRSIPFVYGVHDLWPEGVEATGMLKSRRLLKWLARLERFVYRRASAITVVSPGFKSNLVGKGVPPDKVHVLTDWANESVYRPVTPDSALAEETGMAGRFNVLFGGNIGPAQALATVLEAAQRLSHLPDIQFVIAGDGVDKARLEALVREKGLTNVRFLGQQPAEKMPHLYALSDVLLAHFKRDPLFEISIPSKVFAYMACRRPVLMASQGDAANLVKAAGAGVTCKAEDPDTLAKAVVDLYSMSPHERARMGDAGRQAFLQQYSREVLLQRHGELLRQVASQGAQSMEPVG
jgi:glycosyltransferase involved in cell wall biosynthesis